VETAGPPLTGGSHRVPSPAARLDQYLVQLLPELTRSQAQRLIEEGNVRVNGAISRPAARLRAGDQITWTIPAPKPARVKGEPMALSIAYEDEHLLVIDKPAGLVVHPGPGHSSGTLVHGLLGREQAWSSIGGVERPGIVHRLDRDTSGLMVVAKDDATHRELARQLQERTMSRRYRAIVTGEVAEPRARIEAAIGRDPHHRQRMAVLAGGREAVTEFSRLDVVPGHSLLEVSLKTGRTHQVRVHLAYVHHPVLGDRVYGKRSDLIARPALHAAQLSFRHPLTGRVLTLESPPPDDFVRAWDALSERKMR
jgi:23S rRNA pseudouridine1911/1915/1917 synthase